MLARKLALSPFAANFRYAQNRQFGAANFFACMFFYRYAIPLELSYRITFLEKKKTPDNSQAL